MAGLQRMSSVTLSIIALCLISFVVGCMVYMTDVITTTNVLTSARPNFIKAYTNKTTALDDAFDTDADDDEEESDNGDDKDDEENADGDEKADEESDNASKDGEDRKDVERTDDAEKSGGNEMDENDNRDLFTAALNHTMHRKQTYEDQNRTYSWPLRGIGYLYEHKGVILAGNVSLAVDDIADNPEAERRGYIRRGRSRGLETDTKPMRVVRIYNTNEPIDCSKLLLWVRVNGPEIFAGHATAVVDKAPESHFNGKVPAKCHWEFEFDAQKPGQYTVDAKVLEYNFDAQPFKCDQVSNNSSLVESFPVKRSFLGFKMYNADIMCCEICNRLEGHCKAWSLPIPAFPKQIGGIREGCVLYFSNETSYGIPYSASLEEMELRNETQYDTPDDEKAENLYGLPHGKPTSYFLGCGWSYWFSLDFPCLSGDDDGVFFIDHEFNLDDASTSSELRGKTESGKDEQHLQDACALDSESHSMHKGRWVRDPWPTKEQCPHDMELLKDGNFNKFDMMKHYGSDDPNCWHRDNLSYIGHKCLEMNCSLFKKSSTWISSVHNEQQWYGQWKHDSGCSYTQYTDDELQKCIDRRKIRSIQVEGLSISEFLNEYMKQRLEHIKMYDGSEGENEGSTADGLNIHLSTLKMLHQCKFAADDGIRPVFENLPNVAEGEEFYWVNGYFLSSEREIWCTSHRMKEFNLLGEEILQPKGYKMINAFDMSAALTYDTGTQNDGMHLIGPTMKMIIAKFFHYVCSESD